MRTFLLALVASTALSAASLAQSTGNGTTAASPSTMPSAMPSASTGSNSGSGGTETGSDSGATTAAQNQNPSIYGNGEAPVFPGQNWASGEHGMTQMGMGSMMGGMMGSMMTCASPAPMGGPGSFACYPTQQMGMGPMGMGMGMGWHPHMHSSGQYGWNGGYGAPMWNNSQGRGHHGWGKRPYEPQDSYGSDATGSVNPPNRGGPDYGGDDDYDYNQ